MHGCNDRIGRRQTTLARIASRQTSGFGFNDVHTARCQRGNILLNCGVLPHFGMHSRTHDDWRTRGNQDIGHEVG